MGCCEVDVGGGSTIRDCCIFQHVSVPKRVVNHSNNLRLEACKSKGFEFKLYFVWAHY